MFRDGFCPSTNIPLLRNSLCDQGGMTSFQETKMTCHHFLAPEQSKKAVKPSSLGIYGTHRAWIYAVYTAFFDLFRVK